MTEYAGRGDPRVSMALLWGTGDGPTRGPKPGLSVAEIVAAAIAIADADGLDGLSMRKVGEQLGKSTMALYTYVPGKAELLDVMLDRVLAELASDFTGLTVADGWRSAAEASARHSLAFYERHPWVLQVASARAVLGPHELDVYEAQLALFIELGLRPTDVTMVVGVLASFVRGSAKAIADTRAAEAATGLSDDEWWTRRSELLDELGGDVWATRYPVSSRLGDEHAFDQSDRAEDDATPYTVREALDVFEFGLQRLLDGIEHYIAPEPTGA